VPQKRKSNQSSLHFNQLIGEKQMLNKILSYLLFRNNIHVAELVHLK
jgi:hypothetical protein